MTLSKEIKGPLRTILASDSVMATRATIRAVSGLTRYRILVLLYSHPSGLTATDLTEIFSASASMISHQLHILKKHDLIVGYKRGPMIVYQLNEKNAERFLGQERT